MGGRPYDPFGDYTAEDELIWQIGLLLDAIGATNRISDVDLASKTLVELEILYDEVCASFDRWLRRQRDRRQPRRPAHSVLATQLPRYGALDFATLSLVNGRYIWERSG